MRIVSHGVDIVESARIERIWKHHGDAFLSRIYTPAERQYCLDCRTPAVRLAGRFAAKEAVLKALGTGWRGRIAWTDVETLPDQLGRPCVRLDGETARLAARQGIDEFLISISHASGLAIASAIGVSRG